MITLIVLGAIICFLLVLCFLPLSIDLVYEDDCVFKIKYAGITLINSEKSIKAKAKNHKKDTNTTPEKKDNFIKKTYKQKGMSGTVKYFSNILSIVLKKLWWLLKHFKFRKFKFDLTIATDDAANTAIQYGEICAALYPIFAVVQSVLDVKPELVNINADFEKTNWEFKTCVKVRAGLIYWLIASIGALAQYFKFQRKECEKA
ncbi:MAG: DUF2953 domain-containing protein [Ruminococcaceae bacterium]|nr:DUF2953 domain-containing protein [Oscillospiraceae bacterium]